MFVTVKVLSQYNVMEWIILMQSFKYAVMVTRSNLNVESGGFNSSTWMNFLGSWLFACSGLAF